MKRRLDRGSWCAAASFLCTMSVSKTEQAGVINGDVAGYSRLTADNEIETHQTLRAFRNIIEEAVLSHGGELVEFVGDEFLAILPSAADGVGGRRRRSSGRWRQRTSGFPQGGRCGSGWG